MVKRGILIASFGTTAAETWDKTLGAVAREVRERFPNIPVYEAVTSGIVRRVLAKRGQKTLDVPAAFRQMAAEGIRAVTVLPTFVIRGIEYDRLAADCAEARREGYLREILLLPPLLDRPGDLVRAAEAVLERQGTLPSDAAMVLMGHGTDHSGDFAYGALDCTLRELGQGKVLAATVEGQLGFESVLRRLGEREGIRRVVLRPFLITAGEHTKSDMAGEGEGSWKNRLAAAGYEADCVLEGLGEIPAIREMLIGRLAGPEEFVNPL